SVSDGDFAQERLKELALLVGTGALNFFRKKIVDESVDAADKEAGNAGHARDISAGSCKLLKPSDVSFRHAFIRLLREQQRDVYIDAFADQLLNCRNSRRSRRHFDHYVLASDSLPQTARLFQRSFGVVGEIGRNFEADVTVTSFRCRVNRSQDVG